jgi:hypothetical protein
VLLKNYKQSERDSQKLPLAEAHADTYGAHGIARTSLG